MIWFLIIGAFAGWLAEKFTKGSGFGVFGNVLVGIVGAFVGWILFAFLGLQATGLIGEIVTATVGAIVFLTGLGQIRK
ncbi:MAG: GlsB/YeaQ/YmgE family stress response membrane protein [Fuerstiella sp.]|jgi:uncharacterized membrane protein YeaQ/YmgE (transglycosylase-associated protein family)|nr:GlsB/YeaQ/YmgE family stress response membrane protein [Fuerstiella sp.]